MAAADFAPDPGGERRRKVRSAAIRARILRYLSGNSGFHDLGRIREDGGLRGVLPAELWPELRALADLDLVAVSHITVVQPCYGFEFVQTLPVFAHRRHAAGRPLAAVPTSRNGRGGGDG